MTWVDSHCHLTALGDPDDALRRGRAVGVEAVVCIGTDVVSSRAACALAADHADVFPTVGLHPHEASRFAAEWEELAELAADAAVVAVGETGLDFHYRHSSPDAQEAAFRAHIRLAHGLGRALVIHSRDAWDDTFRVLADEGAPERTVFHCFTGGSEEADRALALGAWLSFSGIVSFRNADAVRAAATRAPPDRLLVETDAPYLAPVPHRGRQNEPAFLVDVGTALAAVTDRAVDDVAAATRASAASAFGIPGGAAPTR